MMQGRGVRISLAGAEQDGIDTPPDQTPRTSAEFANKIGTHQECARAQTERLDLARKYGGNFFDFRFGWGNVV